MILRLRWRYLVTSLPSKTPVCYIVIKTMAEQLLWQALARSSDILITTARKEKP